MLSYNRPHWTQTCECLQWFCLALFIVLIVIRNCLVVYCWKKKKISTSLVFFFYSKLCTKWFAVWLCLASVGRYWCMLPYVHIYISISSQLMTFVPKFGKMSHFGPFTTESKEGLEKTQLLHHRTFKCTPKFCSAWTGICHVRDPLFSIECWGSWLLLLLFLSAVEWDGWNWQPAMLLILFKG